MNTTNKKLWKNYGKYLYPSYKNEDEIGKAIVLTILCLIINAFIPCIPIIWTYCYYKCKENNEGLDKDPKRIGSNIVSIIFLNKLK